MTRMPLSFPATHFGLLTANWWDQINDSVEWQDGIFYTLCAAYTLVSSIALIQLIRIGLRVPEYGWTTQKVFHLMNFIVNGVRAVVFGFHKQIFLLHPKVLTFVLLDLPGILFFSTYTLLVLFWAEIYHQARSLPTDKLRIYYISINCGIYFLQVCIWAYLWIDDNSVVEFIGKIFIAVVSFIAALSFLFYGGRLFFMLRRFPIESKGGRKKLHEVGSVTAICFTCFLIRCFVFIWILKSIVIVQRKIREAYYFFGYWFFIPPSGVGKSTFYKLCTAAIISFEVNLYKDVKIDGTLSSTLFFESVVLSAFDADASLDVLDHPVLNLICYMLVEILPSALVLYILRKLPPKRISAQYHPIR